MPKETVIVGTGRHRIRSTHLDTRRKTQERTRSQGTEALVVFALILGGALAAAAGAIPLVMRLADGVHLPLP